MPDSAVPNSDNPFYARGDIAARYERSRTLPADVEQQWARLLAAHVGFPPNVCVDLGCGTGHFTRVLARALGGFVVGVDPSLPMLRAAAETLRGAPGVFLVRGRADALPLATGCADVILMSMSYHHVPDKPAALASIHRVLRANGALCVRTCSTETLDTYLYPRFFPEARAFDERRFPSRSGLRDEVSRAGFELRRIETVSQRVADSLPAYRENTAQRAHSDLQAITDAQFAAGMRRLDEWIAAQSDAPVFEDIDLFTFTATSPL